MMFPNALSKPPKTAAFSQPASLDRTYLLTHTIYDHARKPRAFTYGIL